MPRSWHLKSEAIDIGTSARQLTEVIIYEICIVKSSGSLGGVLVYWLENRLNDPNVPASNPGSATSSSRNVVKYYY